MILMPVFYSINVMNLQKVEDLIKSGSNINIIKDNNGDSALHFASALGNVYLKHSIFYKNSLNLRVNKIWAITTSKMFIVNAKRTFLVKIFLFLGDIQIVRKLLTSGADVNILDRNGRTALHRAVCSNVSIVGHESVVELLIENHVNISTRATNGESATDIILKKLNETERNSPDYIGNSEKPIDYNQTLQIFLQIVL